MHRHHRGKKRKKENRCGRQPNGSDGEANDDGKGIHREERIDALRWRRKKKKTKRSRERIRIDIFRILACTLPYSLRLGCIPLPRHILRETSLPSRTIYHCVGWGMTSTTILPRIMTLDFFSFPLSTKNFPMPRVGHRHTPRKKKTTTKKTTKKTKKKKRMKKKKTTKKKKKE